MWIVEQANTHGARSTRLALFEAAKTFIERFDERDSGQRRQSEVEKHSMDGREHREVFTAGMGLALLEDRGPISYDQESENLRQARIQLALAMVQGNVARALQRGQLEKILRGWLDKERSRPLRAEIERLMRMLSQSNER